MITKLCTGLLGAALSLSVVSPAVSAQSVSPLSTASSGSAAENGYNPANTNPFYHTPNELPEQPGELIRTQPMNVLLPISGLRPLPKRATRVMYTSRNTHDEPIATTGAFLESAAPWRGKGERPVAVLASGTMGMADNCASSRAIEAGLLLDITPNQGLSVAAGYEMLQAMALNERGFNVFVVDYEGLGTEGLHPYMNRKSQAHTTLDGARAALKMAQAGHNPDTPVVLYGYSQGGGATAAAAELQSAYAPELNVKGTFAGAPPADLSEVAKKIDGSAIVGAMGYFLAGLIDQYPQFGDIIEPYMLEQGKIEFEAITHQCIPDSIARLGLRYFKSLTKNGLTPLEILAKEPELQKYVEMQRIGTLKPAAPVLIVTGIYDDAIPVGQAKELGAAWCAQGANVTVIEDAFPELAPRTVLNHGAPMLTNVIKVLDYLEDRVNDVPTTGNCSQ